MIDSKNQTGLSRCSTQRRKRVFLARLQCPPVCGTLHPEHQTDRETVYRQGQSQQYQRKKTHKISACDYNKPACPLNPDRHQTRRLRSDSEGSAFGHLARFCPKSNGRLEPNPKPDDRLSLKQAYQDSHHDTPLSKSKPNKTSRKSPGQTRVYSDSFWNLARVSSTLLRTWMKSETPNSRKGASSAAIPA